MRALTLVVTLCALVLAGCGSDTNEEAVAPTTTGATETARLPDASGRPRAPAVEGTSLDGEPISLADYRERPVFVNVWSSW